MGGISTVWWCTIVAEPQLLDQADRPAQLHEAAQAFALRALQLGIPLETNETALRHALNRPDAFARTS